MVKYCNGSDEGNIEHEDCHGCDNEDLPTFESNIVSLDKAFDTYDVNHQGHYAT